MKGLLFGASPTAPTGFGRLSEEIIKFTREEIDWTVWGCNHHHHDDIPSGIEEIEILRGYYPKDGHGRGEFLKTFARRGEQFDILVLSKDTFVLSEKIYGIEEEPVEFILACKSFCEELDVTLISNYPVEEYQHQEIIEPTMCSDAVILYCDWAKDVVEDVASDEALENTDLYSVGLGANLDTFYPMPEEEIQQAKEKFLPDPSSFVIGYVGDNQRRKNIPRDVMETFAYYYSNSDHNPFLLMKTEPAKDSVGWDLEAVKKQLCKKYDIPGTSIGFAGGGSEQRLSSQLMNTLYNVFDALYLPSMEGWGLPVTESFATRTLTIVGDHAALSEIGADGRSLKVEVPTHPDYSIWLSRDHNVRRTLISMDSASEQFDRAITMGEEERNSYLDRAENWIHENDWNSITDEWLEIINKHCQ